MWLLDRLAANSEIIRTVATGLTTGLVITVVGAVLAVGGLKSVHAWLVRVLGPDADDAKAKIREGLQFHQKPTDEEDRRVTLLIEGFDQWRSVTAKQVSRRKAVDQSKWLLAGMIVAVAAMWTCRFLSAEHGTHEATIAAAWLLVTIFFAVRAAPVAMVLLEHGKPTKADAAPPTPALPEAAPRPFSADQSTLPPAAETGPGPAGSRSG